MRVLAHPEDFMLLYKKLKANPNKHKAMLDAIENIKQQLINSDRPLGAHHKRENIPRLYLDRYRLQSLYHFDMPSDFRLMYSVRLDPSACKKEALFLELLTHDEYNKLFGYFKRKSH